MARFNAPQFSEFPFHITGRRHNKDAFNLELDLVWTILTEHLFLTHHFFGLRIHAFVLMPNHFHLICRTDQDLLGTALGYFMRETSKTMNFYSGRCNQNWGSRYYRCEIASNNYYMNCYKYVYQNPVRANLSESCEDWKYSTLNGLVGESHLIVPVESDTILFSDKGLLINENLKWLNTRPSDDNLNDVRSALKKRNFKLPQTKNKKTHFLESGLL
ncbi:MAG: hypothetical protein H7256_05285 [Bdellovibrio sp.]|nr:hypothetical protein [Bdellovibrio sp.]